MKGKVYIVGAGPGDPELITLKGFKILREADVILYDRLVSKELLVYAKPEAIKIYVGKEPGRHSYTQDEINRMLVEYASKGYKVLRLKGGDPYIFGRGEEECIYVRRHGIDCEVIPGISSIQAASISSGSPLTSRGYASSFAVFTGVEDPTKGFKSVDPAKIASSVDTVVILMGVSKAREIISEIIKVRGEDTPASVVMNASTESERIFRGSLKEVLKYVEEGHVKPPAVFIIGDTVRLSRYILGEE